MASTDLILSGFPGWFGNRFLETSCDGFERVFALVQPGRVDMAAALLNDMKNAGTKISDVHIIPIDVTDRGACERLELDAQGATLVHGAGIIHPKRAGDFGSVNVEGTKNILSVATRCAVQKAVVISSNSPCGCNPNPEHRFTSESPYNPYMGYGASKMRMENLAKDWAAHTACPLTILRPCWFFGPHQPERQAKFFRMVHGGRVPILGSGKNVRSITYVDDLCQAVTRALERHSAGVSTYWIALAKAYAMREIVDAIRDVMQNDFNLKPRTGHIPLPDLFSTLAMAGDAAIQAAGGYHQELHVLGEMNKNIACSIEAAQTELGFVPQTDLHAAVRGSIEWALSHGQNLT